MLRLSSVFTKRWIGFFALYFLIWYPISFTLTSVYQVVGQSALLLAGSVFTVTYWLFISYMYFRKARNDWSSRFLVGFSWIAMVLFLSAVLVKPVFGGAWTDVFNVYILFGVFVNVSSIILGGFLATHSGVGMPLERSIEASPLSSDQPLQEQDSELLQ